MKKNNENKIANNYVTTNRWLFALISCILSMFPFVLKLAVPKGMFYASENVIFKNIACISASFEEFDIKWTLYFFFVFYFYIQVLKKKLSKGECIAAIIGSLILTTIIMIGKCLKIDNTLSLITIHKYQILKFSLISVGYFCIFFYLYLAAFNIDYSKIIKKKKKSDLEEFFNKYQFIISIVLIIVSWVPIMVVYYPGVASGDTLDSLAQFLNIRELSWSAKAIELVNNKVLLNKHHSVLFTVVFGLIFKLGSDFSTYNFGMFLYVLLQTIILIFTFSFLLYYMKKIQIPTIFRVFSLLFICFCPIISGYTIAAIKDTMGAILIVIYNLFLLQIVRNYEVVVKNKLYLIVFMISILLILMIKSNSEFIIYSSYIALLIYYYKDKVKFKKLLLILCLPLFIFYCYDRILLGELDVTGTNKKESYSIPYMQLARLANRNTDYIDDDDKVIINNVLDYKAIKKDYNPELADSVKNTYRLGITKYEEKRFWDVYFKYMFKYPKVYIAAFINSTYGYYFPEVGETMGIDEVDYRLNNKYFKIRNKEYFKDCMLSHRKIQEIFTKIPFFNIFNHVAFYVYFLIFSAIYIIKNKNFKYLIPIISLIAVFISCLISPINGSFRYILAIVFCIPLIISIDCLCYREEVK